MTTNNNYDQSKTGTNIEATVFYDTCMSQMHFDDTFKIMQHSSYYKNTKAYYIDHGNVKDHDDLSFSVKGDKSEKVRFLEKELTFDKSEIESWDDETIDDETIDDEIMGQYGDRISLLTYEDCNDYMLKDFKLEIIPSKTIEKIITRGYSQGDYAEVFYCPDDLEKTWGSKPNENDLQKMFSHYFWDAPIYARIEINGDEYHYHDQDEYDKYKWERDKFLKFVSEKSGVSIEELSAVLPEDPSYD